MSNNGNWMDGKMSMDRFLGCIYLSHLKGGDYWAFIDVLIVRVPCLTVIECRSKTATPL